MRYNSIRFGIEKIKIYFSSKAALSSKPKYNRGRPGFDVGCKAE